MDINDKIINNSISYSSIIQDVYDRNRETNSMIKSSLASLFKRMKEHPDETMVLLPMAKDLLETNVKNDTQLLKVSDSIQKLIISLQDNNEVDDNAIFNILDSIDDGQEQNKVLNEYNKTITDIDEITEKEQIQDI